MVLSLLGLPNEVLCRIFSYLDLTHLRPCGWNSDNAHLTGEEYTNARPSLYALTLTNRRLRYVARRVLVEDVSLYIGGSGPKYPSLFEKDAVNFAKYCIKYPDVLERLRKFSIRWDTPTPVEWATKLFNTVSLAPNLTVFKIEKFDDYTDPGYRREVLETLVRRLRFLEVFVVNIDGVCIPHHLFLAICCMRYLCSFETNCPILALDPDRESAVGIDSFFEDVPNNCIREMRLEKLCCTGEYVDLAVLRYVLTRSPHLEKLVLSLPGPGLDPYYGDSIVSDESKPKSIGKLFSPDLVSRMLMPSASSLRELSITNDRMQLSQTNGSMIDLRSFSQLQRLTLSNRLISKVTNQSLTGMPSLVIEAPDERWYKCLPVCLEYLKIQFDCLGGLLWNLAALQLLENEYLEERVSENSEDEGRGLRKWHAKFEMEYFWPSVSREVQDESFHQLNWIMGITKDISSKFPNLNTIHVVENANVPVDTYNRSWDLLDLVAWHPNAFGRPGLDLELSVRVPDGFVPQSFDVLTSESIVDCAQKSSSLSQVELLQALSAQDLRHEEANHGRDANDLSAAWGHSD